jgi:predicted ABC-type exoprotein transport system permease subunit
MAILDKDVIKPIADEFQESIEKVDKYRIGFILLAITLLFGLIAWKIDWDFLVKEEVKIHEEHSKITPSPTVDVEKIDENTYRINAE